MPTPTADGRPGPLYTTELDVALRTIHVASLLTKSVLVSLKNHVEAETKLDDSPVTIADFAAQAVIISALHSAFPNDAFVGEESADQLRENAGLADRVWELVLRAKALHSDTAFASASSASASAVESQTSDLQHVQGLGLEHGVTALSFPASKEEMLQVIDLGASTDTKRGRVWVLDPVDGTATFMEGKQYAVCLCLLVDGVQQLGVIGCPNLAFDPSSPLGKTPIHEDLVDDGGYGVLLSAVKDQGAYVRSMHATDLAPPVHIRLDSLSPKQVSNLNFAESTLGKTSLSQEEHRAVAESLAAQWPGTVLWSQQMKYVALTLGATDVVVRIPKTKERHTYIWDHAGGHLLFQEAGGKIRDFNGGAIDFSQGRKIKGERNFGMIASLPWAFDQVDRAVKDVLSLRGRREP